MKNEQIKVKEVFRNLISQRIHTFPPSGRLPAEITSDQGVYIIYRKDGRVLHVGRSSRGKRGVFQRLNNHLAGQSSFVESYFKRDKSRVRACGFRYLPVKNDRLRALVEAYATGVLCPAHIGLNKKINTSN